MFVGPSLGKRDGKIVDNDAPKAEAFQDCFWSVLGRTLDDVFPFTVIIT